MWPAFNLRALLRQGGWMLANLALALSVSALVGWGLLGFTMPVTGEILWLFAKLGLLVGGIALVCLQPAVLGRFGSLRWQILAVITLGGVLVASTLHAVAQAMFLSWDHDLPLLLMVLSFVVVLAIGFGSALAGALTARLDEVRGGAARLAGGDLGARLELAGRDEVAALASDFNRMADALAASAARQADLERARRELVAAVSHDLRTPLTAVRAMVEALADGVVRDEATRARYLGSALSQLENLSTLVDDLFEIAQLDAGVLQLELERASLRDLISDTLSDLQPHAEQQGVRLIGEVAPNVDPVLINPAKLQRVLYNLIGNALRHTPADGTIVLRATAAGGEVRVQVADEGEGIAPEDLPHIFERTYRGEKSRSRDYGGAGLGLAIVRGLVEAHGGRIWAESAPGAGARFTFTLQRPAPPPRP